MLKSFYPCQCVDSVFHIDYNQLWQQGYRALIFDIDNTLVHHGEDSTAEVDTLFQYLHDLGFKTLLLSNNSEERIQRFMKNIDSIYIHDAQKPAVTSYFKALALLQTAKHETVIIGDQLFTDIYGANKSGIDSILVKYMRYDDEQKIGIKRNLEKVILTFYRFSKPRQHRLGNIHVKDV